MQSRVSVHTHNIHDYLYVYLCCMHIRTLYRCTHHNKYTHFQNGVQCMSLMTHGHRVIHTHTRVNECTVPMHAHQQVHTDTAHARLRHHQASPPFTEVGEPSQPRARLLPENNSWHIRGSAEVRFLILSIHTDGTIRGNQPQVWINKQLQ